MKMAPENFLAMYLHKAFTKFCLKLAGRFTRKPINGTYNQFPYIITPTLCHHTQGISSGCEIKAQLCQWQSCPMSSRAGIQSYNTLETEMDRCEFQSLCFDDRQVGNQEGKGRKANRPRRVKGLHRAVVEMTKQVDFNKNWTLRAAPWGGVVSVGQPSPKGGTGRLRATTF